MGGKKKQEAAKKDTAVDDSTERLYRSYRRHLADYGIPSMKKVDEKLNELRDDKNPGKLTDLVIWDEVGPAGIRAIADALRESDYAHLRNIRLWKTGSEDEGLRAITQYMREYPFVSCLEVVESEISPLGCEFLGEILSPNIVSVLVQLKLDYNNFGNAGLANLSQGLRANAILTHLSLGFCQIDENGARSLFEIFIFQGSVLEDVNLQGNILRNPGIWTVFHGLQVNSSITKLNLADNEFGEDSSVLEKLHDVLANNETLELLDLRYNGIYDTGANQICDMYRNQHQRALNSNITQLLLPQNKVSDELLNELERLVGGSRRGKKGKRGKKKKK